MEHFRLDNTEGFKPSELKVMNACMDAELSAINEADREEAIKSLSEHICNAMSDCKAMEANGLFIINAVEIFSLAYKPRYYK